MDSKANSSTEVLKAAAWIIENVGWTQRASFRDKIGMSTQRNDSQIGSVCLLGAVSLVNADDAVKYDATCRLNNTIWNSYYTGIVSYNDADARTKEQVLEIIERTIAETK